MTLQEGATVEEAIRASGLLELRTDIDLTKNKVGISTAVRQNSANIVHDGDWVEIYVLHCRFRKSFAGTRQKISE
ncbi:RnfH family protein [Shigella sonnei]